MSDRVFSILRISLLVGLLFWGLYTLLYYLGVPVHQMVLIDTQTMTAIDNICAADAYFCRGWRSLAPFIGHTFGQLKPFMGYIITSLLIFAGVVGFEFFRSGRVAVRIRFTPLRLIGIFLGFLWLLFTMLSFADSGDQPYRRVFEPLPQVYTNASEEGLAILKANYDDLKNRGCLRYVGQSNNGAEVHDLKLSCIQKGFFTRVLPLFVAVLGLLFVLLTLGRLCLRLLRLPMRHPLAEALFSAGLGSGALILLLWLLSLAGFYVQAAGWVLLAAILAAGYKDAWYWIKKLRDASFTYEAPVYAGTLLLGWILLSYLALNFLNVVRPFPIGWDDLGRYLNQPRLLVSYGHFIPTLASFQWEYMTSLGFLLFGYDSIFGATLSMMINWMAGFLAVGVVYGFGRLYLGRGQGLLAALLYYTLPLVGHFSFADMKVDNAVFFAGGLSLLAVFMALFPIADEEEANENADVTIAASPDWWRWMVLAGLLGGLGFAFKPTTVMVLVALFPIIFGAMVHWSAFLGAFFLGWVVYLMEGRLNLADISTRVFGAPDVLHRPVILGCFLVLGLGLWAYAAKLHPRRFLRAGLLFGVFILSCAAAVAPWLLYNNARYGNVVPKLILSAPNDLTPTFAIAGETPTDYGQKIRSLPPELQVDPDHAACKSTAKSEELDRYWGYHSGWTHYLTLPWRAVMNLDSTGYYVTVMPALLLFVLLLLVPFVWMRQGAWLRWLFFGTIFILMQWVLFANGIPWYGLGVFFGLVIGLEALVFRAPDDINKSAAAVLIGLSLMVNFGMRLWQFEQQRNIFEYAMGKVSAEAMEERTIPHYDDIRDMIEERTAEMPETPYVYRIGTFIPYFIPKNLEVLPVADHQLDFFNCLYQERDGRLTLQRIKALGFNSFIFDTNTHTIERDPNGSLHKKVQEFVDFLNTPGLGMQIVVNDPGAGIAFILIPETIPEAPAEEDAED